MHFCRFVELITRVLHFHGQFGYIYTFQPILGMYLPKMANVWQMSEANVWQMNEANVCSHGGRVVHECI